MYRAPDQDTALLHQERQAHDAFAETRRRIYVERSPLLQRLDELAIHGGSPIVVTGESGAGKSALLAYWSHSWRSRHHESFLVDHYIGAGTMGTSPAGLLRRIMLEIRTRFHLLSQVPDSPDSVVTAFPEWLAAVSGRERIVLVIDALNQLPRQTPSPNSGTSAHPSVIDWLPLHIPPSVSLLISSAAGPAFDALALRNWETIEVDLLSEEERRIAFRRYLGNSMRDPSFEVEQRMTTDTLFANPLFLMTSIQELRTAPSWVSRSIDHYHLAESIDQLFDGVLERFEHEHGEEAVRELMTLIWGMRQGLSIDEAPGIAPILMERLPKLLDSLEYYLVRQGSQILFFHEQMRTAVEKRYLSDADSGIALRLRIADYYLTQPPSERRAFEQPWQLLQARLWDRLEECIVAPDMFLILSNRHNEFDLLAYWHALYPPGPISTRYLDSFARLDHSTTHLAIDELHMQLGGFLRLYGELEAAAESFEKALSLRQIRLGYDHPDTVYSSIRLADILIDLGRYDEAEKLCRSAVSIQEQTLGADDMITISSVHTLGMLLFNRGMYSEAESLLRRALIRRETSLAADDPVVAESCRDLAMAVRSQGNSDEAERLLRRAIRICEVSYGREHPATATMLIELAPLLGELGRIEESIAMHRHALAILESAFGPDHLETAQSYHNLAHILGITGEDQEAELLARSALRVHRKRLGAHHPSTAISLYNLARLLVHREEYHEAETMFRQALDVFNAVIGAEHPTTIICQGTLAATLMELQSLDEAGSLIHDALQSSRRTAGERHFNTAVCMVRSADLNYHLGHYDLSAHQATEALSILEETVGRPHTFSALAILVLASTEIENGEQAKAELLHAEALAILASLPKPDSRLSRRLADLKSRIAAQPAPHLSAVRPHEK